MDWVELVVTVVISSGIIGIILKHHFDKKLSLYSSKITAIYSINSALQEYISHTRNLVNSPNPKNENYESKELLKAFDRAWNENKTILNCCEKSIKTFRQHIIDTSITYITTEDPKRVIKGLKLMKTVDRLEKELQSEFRTCLN
jgi:hypothetical protein